MKSRIKVTLNCDLKVISETLSRLGIISNEKMEIYPSCYIIFDKFDNCYRICHFKELFAICNDQAYDNLSDADIERRDAIVNLLINWGLIKGAVIETNNTNVNFIAHYKKYYFKKITVVPYKNKHMYTVVHKFKQSKLNGEII